MGVIWLCSIIKCPKFPQGSLLHDTLIQSVFRYFDAVVGTKMEHMACSAHLVGKQVPTIKRRYGEAHSTIIVEYATTAVF
jgi:hypothetical protein